MGDERVSEERIAALRARIGEAQFGGLPLTDDDARDVLDEIERLRAERERFARVVEAARALRKAGRACAPWWPLIAGDALADALDALDGGDQ